MAFLRLQDYSRFKIIQQAQLSQLIFDTVIEDVENAAITEIKSKISQKYDIADVFRDTVVFDITATYKAKQLVYLDAPAYSSAATYVLNDQVLQLGNVYYCSTAITIPEAFNMAHWTLIGPQYAFYNIPTPYPQFNYKNIYAVGDLVWYKDKVYKCLTETALLDHNNKIQYNSISAIPYYNSFPDTIGQTQWSAGVSYSFFGLNITATPADYTAYNSTVHYVIGDRVNQNSTIYQAFANSFNTAPGTDFTKWLPIAFVPGDNRNAQLVQKALIMVVYWLHRDISPKNIPMHRKDDYAEAIRFLERAADGKENLDIQLLQPDQGRRISWGGKPKLNNDY